MKRVLIILSMIIIAFVMFVFYIRWQQTIFNCGGLAGIKCPEGYYCEYEKTLATDKQGVCKKK